MKIVINPRFLKVKYTGNGIRNAGPSDQPDGNGSIETLFHIKIRGGLIEHKNVRGLNADHRAGKSDKEKSIRTMLIIINK